MADDNDIGRFRAMRVDGLKNFVTQTGIPCSGKKKDKRENTEPLEAYTHKKSEQKRRLIIENDGTMSTFTQDAMRQMALFRSAV